jgi:hypothetical protein
MPGVKRALSHWQVSYVELLLLMVGNGSGEPGGEDHSRVGMFAHRMGPHRKPLSGARRRLVQHGCVAFCLPGSRDQAGSPVQALATSAPGCAGKQCWLGQAAFSGLCGLLARDPRAGGNKNMRPDRAKRGLWRKRCGFSSVPTFPTGSANRSSTVIVCHGSVSTRAIPRQRRACLVRSARQPCRFNW